MVIEVQKKSFIESDVQIVARSFATLSLGEQKEDPCSSLADLPSELIEKIFEFLNVDSSQTFGCACKLLNAQARRIVPLKMADQIIETVEPYFWDRYVFPYTNQALPCKAQMCLGNASEIRNYVKLAVLNASVFTVDRLWAFVIGVNPFFQFFPWPRKKACVADFNNFLLLYDRILLCSLLQSSVTTYYSFNFPIMLPIATDIRFIGTKLSSIPFTIGELESLSTLTLSGHQLEHIPPSIGNLMYLRHLSIQRSRVRVLPSSIGGMQNLEGLFLVGNKLESLPSSIGCLKKLTFLILQRNCLKSLPWSLTNTPLRLLDIHENPMLVADPDSHRVLAALAEQGCEILLDVPLKDKILQYPELQRFS